MTLTHLLFPYRLLARQQRLIRYQARLIDRQQDEIHRAHLDYAREMQGLVCAWLLSIETPETDLRHELADLERTLGNRIAELEEHVI